MLIAKDVASFQPSGTQSPTLTHVEMLLLWYGKAKYVIKEILWRTDIMYKKDIFI